MRYLLLILLSSPALACKCLVDGNAVKILNRSDAVFVGDLVKSENGVATFKVVENLKNATGVVEVRYRTPAASSTCKIGLRGRMVVWAYADGAGLSADGCSLQRATQRSQILEDLRAAAQR